MPTVDDLTISLTIKDNSNLDKLRKNLDAILKTKAGVGGAGAGAGRLEGELKREISYIRSSLYDINSQMNFLLPNISPHAEDRVAQQEYARRISGGIEMFKGQIAKFLSPEKIDSLRNLAKDLNITELTTEKMQEGIEKLMDKYNMIVQSIAKGELVMTDEKAKKFLDSIRDVINKILGGGGNLTSLRKIEKNIPEALIQIVMERMMDKLKIKKKGQFRMVKVGVKEADEKKLGEWFKDVPKEVVDKLKLMFKGKSIYTGLLTAMKDLGYKPEDLVELFSGVGKIEGNEGILNLIKGLLKLKQEGDLDFLAIPGVFQELVMKLTKVQTRASGVNTQTLLDINVFTGEVEKLKEILPNITTDTEAVIKNLGSLAIELKTFLDASGKGNLELQSLIYGKDLLVVSSMMSAKMRETLDEWGTAHTTLPYLQDLMVKSGVTTDIQTQEELSKSIGDLANKIDMKKIIDYLTIVEKKIEGNLTADQIKAIMGPIAKAWEDLLNKTSLPDT